MIPIPIYIFILIELIFVAYGDIKTDKIPNAWSILNLISFILLLILEPNTYHLSLDVFLVSFTFLVVGFVLFLLNIMGGGDSKFLFTFFLLVPESLQDTIFANLLVSTIVVGSIFFITNFIKNLERLIKYFKARDIKGIKRCFGTKFSFAPVILIAWVWLGWSVRESFPF